MINASDINNDSNINLKDDIMAMQILQVLALSLIKPLTLYGYRWE